MALAVVVGFLIALTWLAPIDSLAAADRAIAWLTARADTDGQLIATVVLLSVAALGFTISWARHTALARPIRLPSGARISIDEVAAELRDLFLQNDTVREADVRVDNLHRRGVRVATSLHVSPTADLNRTIDTVCEQAEWFLHAHLLVRLSSIPSVELTFDEIDLRAGRPHDGTAHATGG